ncbi:MAG: hypothetical protein L0213_14915, partial [Candidatus Dadabacteria bacterium]|nr:hypothetical protein [Candidatus Dadabacteria bacterium]
PELISYIGIDVTSDFSKSDPYPVFYYNTKPLKFPPYVAHNTAYCIERGPRPTSIDSHLYAIAKELGVRFEFGQKIDFSKLAPGTIIATGLDPATYKRLGISTRIIYGSWSFREIDKKNATGAIYMGPFSTDYGYTAQTNGLDYSLLFTRKPITEKDRDEYRRILMTLGMGEYPEPWREVTMCVPGEAKLTLDNLILTGTLSGMIEPFWGYGIVGALIAGRVAAKAVMNREDAIRDYNGFTRGFSKKLARRDAFANSSAFKRGILTKAGLFWARLQCIANRELASKPREPLKWFR